MTVKVINAAEAEILNVLGIPHAVLVERHENPSGYEIMEITGAAGMSVPLHVHKNEDETFYVADGKVAFMTKDGEFVGTAGTCVNLPRGVPHGYRIMAPNSRMVLTVSPGTLVPMFRELASLPPGEPDLEAVAAVVNRYEVNFV